MQRYSSAIAKASSSAYRGLMRRSHVVVPNVDVFINHRGIDTKRTVSGLLYDHLSAGLRVNSFLDSKNMKPGDRLFDNIEAAIRRCKVGVAVFSPRYCDSYFCLHELALMMESRKRVVPIFCDVKPSELFVKDFGDCPSTELRRFTRALEEAKDWSEFMRTATDAVLKNLMEVEGGGRHRQLGYSDKNRKYIVQKMMNRRR
ncbi:unnamed protein product [Linum tenue]|uniref:TIR domain-containing protein n=1 Tax=Linum tenue TaxID=586396 RepID=A0AAV0PD76_9ROSI|nr:unnamed protein product [Linum tenue]